MREIVDIRKAAVTIVAFVLVGLLLPVEIATGQEEVASAIRRYKEREASTGYYEEYEVRPSNRFPRGGIPGVKRRFSQYSPTAAAVRVRTRLADSHRGIKFYYYYKCQDCHINETHDIHTVRANLTCRQCHGGEPIASIDHYYSPLNPIRRHAYVCAKCHEGSTASFASYVVHEPAAGSAIARATFPALYYAYWFMLVLLVGTLGFFIPHSLLVGLRELFGKKGSEK